jgi:hypothetical protein
MLNTLGNYFLGCRATRAMMMEDLVVFVIMWRGLSHCVRAGAGVTWQEVRMCQARAYNLTEYTTAGDLDGTGHRVS